MSETNRLKLPLVQPSQAQKHVTVNEAFVRLDGLTQLVLQSVSVATPPGAPLEGQVWSVPSGAVNAWSGQDGQLALFENGGWLFLAPSIGWRAWIADLGVPALFDGAAWRSGGLSLSPFGAGMSFHVAEIDHVLGAGASSTTANVIPAQSVVYGVTGRVTDAVTGTLTDWDLGVSGSTNRYGSGYGLAADSWLRGLTGSPLAYYADTPLELTANGGDFAGGTVRLAVHYAALAVPSS